MRVSKRYNKHKSFNFRKKKSVAVNNNKVKNQNSDFHDLIYVMQQGSL
jgi:hypothetical protein